MDAGSMPSGWLVVTAAVLAIVWCVNADAPPMSCEVCGSGEVERVFATERFEACHSSPTSPPNTRRQCPPGNHACVTILQANGSIIASKSCAERTVSGCYEINNDKYCYCTQPNCNINANLNITTTTTTTTTTIDTLYTWNKAKHGWNNVPTRYTTLDPDVEDDQEGSADGARFATRQPPILTLVPPKFKTSAAISSHKVITSSVLWISVALRTLCS